MRVVHRLVSVSSMNCKFKLFNIIIDWLVLNEFWNWSRIISRIISDPNGDWILSEDHGNTEVNITFTQLSIDEFATMTCRSKVDAHTYVTEVERDAQTWYTPVYKIFDFF